MSNQGLIRALKIGTIIIKVEMHGVGSFVSKFSKKKIFFSLTRKALFAVIISTLLSSASVFLLGTYVYDKNHLEKRESRHRQYQQAFASVIKQLQQKETELSWLIPTLIRTDGLQHQLLTEMKQLIDENWFKIELESDIRSIYLFSVQGTLLGEWGERFDDQVLTDVWLDTVLTNEQPLSKIVCDKDCLQYHGLPFLIQGKFAGVFVFVTSITDIVLQMKGITGADVGILTQAKNLNNELQASLPSWSLRVGALTDFSVNHALLIELQKHYPEQIPENSVSFFFNDKVYDIFTIPFGEDKHQAKLVVIDNISGELKEKNRVIKLYVFSGLSSILLSAVILFLLFVRPTQKINKIINLLPLIAEKQFKKVRQSLPDFSRTKILRDEIDILGSTAHNLINTLTRLDAEVAQRNQNLLERSQELQNERNFVSNILNTAQVIIIRLDQLGQILSINKYGENLTGYDEVSLVKKHLFTDLIYDNESYELLNEVIPDLLNKKYSTYQHECTLYSLDGIKLYVSWYFTVINNPDTQPEILVVGLDLTERKSVETELAWLADHDPLTRLYNRRRFEHELHRVLKEAERFNHTGALIFFDIDQFKYINDSSGHQAGDDLLLKVTEKLRSAVRDTDVLARFGGDEFVVLAPEINQLHAESLINKIFLLMQEVDIILQGNQHKVSISAGLLMFPVKGYSEQDLMASVDIAMYKAKESGRGTWCLASIEDLNREDIKQRVNWKAKIEKALSEDRFILYFQPIMDVATRKISHYECLLRMIDENGKIIPPGLFIHVAEQTGLISLIDKRVMDLAFKAQRQFIADNKEIVLSVNLSGDLISNPEAFNLFFKLFERNNVTLEKFIFEVTETQAVTNLMAANSLISQIVAMGGKFALDDFGVGFSSMNHLKQLPIQYLKIDGEFIKNISNIKEDRLFVNAIREVAHGMNIATIAEFVENKEILDVLSEIGIDYAQGYGIGKPMPYPEFH